MPSVEELLSQTSEEVYDEPINDIITIDPETRTINLPVSETLFGTEKEMDVERKYFKCPKIVGDNIDLSQHQIYITYVTAKDNMGTFLPDEDPGLYYCEDMAVDETGYYITFSWLLSGNVLSKSGLIAFAVCAKHMDGEILKTRWKTKPAVGTVLLTVPDGDSQIVEAYPDIIGHLLNRMNEVEAQLQKNTEDISSLSDQIANQGGGLSDKVKETLLLLFDNIEYTNDMSGTVKRLSQLFSGVVTKYTVTANLTNVTSNNTITEIEEGTSYTATLSATDGFVIKEITITMSGEDVTANVYSEGKINIVSVSGNIVITATAEEVVSLEPVYAVSELAFDGATAVDTDHNLFDVDKDWTVVTTWSFGTGCHNLATVWSSDLIDFTADTQSVRLSRQNGWFWRICIGGSYVADFSGTDPNMKYIVTKAKGATVATVYSVVDGVKKETELSNSNVLTAIGQHNNVILGYSETMPYYFTGTINDFKIYERILDVTEINAYLGV